MNQLEKLDVRCIAPSMRLKDKDDALHAVAEYAKKSPLLHAVSSKKILESLRQREEIGSTGFGNAIAIPHCRLPEVEDFVIGIINVPSGVDFLALDEKPVRLLVFIIAPESASDIHIRVLSSISRVLSLKGVVDELLALTDAHAIRESFLRHTVLHQDMMSGKKSMVYAFVQDETLFHEILEIFAGIKDSSSIVLDAENIDAHLTRLPLFQGLWSHDPGGFSRVLIAVVDKRFVNELIFQLESKAGDLSQRTDLMITVQDLFYTAGSLGHITV